MQYDSGSYSGMFSRLQKEDPILRPGYELLCMENGLAANPVSSYTALDAHGEIGFYAIARSGEAPFLRAIMMVCFLPGQDQNQYLLWAKTLAEQTGKPVIIPVVSASNSPGRLLESINAVVRFAENVLAGKCRLLARNAVIDLFAYGLGIPVARFLTESSTITLFQRSKVFLLAETEAFCAPEWMKEVLVQPEMDSASGPVHSLRQLEPFMGWPGTSDHQQNREHYFIINLKWHTPVPAFSSRGTTGAWDIDSAVSCINLGLNYPFNAANLFPVSFAQQQAQIDFYYAKIFKLASWFLCGIN